MNVKCISIQQRTLAVQRLTALWAFAESGLGGVLHALQVPFTGLIVGGFAVIIITLIGYFSSSNYNKILQSLFLVLLVKAAVSPHTPVPAYIAVSFQALAGFVVFSLFRINLLSILLLSTLAMIESAIQKLLVLTFFFGTSIWKAADELGKMISKQMSLPAFDGSMWIIGSYIFIYLIGGLVVGYISWKMIKKLSFDTSPEYLKYNINSQERLQETYKQIKSRRKYLYAALLLLISIILWLAPGSKDQRSLSIAKTMIWTLSALVIWFSILTPLFTKLIRWFLGKQQNRYSEQVTSIITFLPVLKLLAKRSWEASSARRGWGRITLFITTLINWSLTYSDPELINASV
jgi:hypothetical protein